MPSLWHGHSLLHVRPALLLQCELDGVEGQGLAQAHGQTRHRNAIKNAGQTNGTKLSDPDMNSS